MEPRADSGVSQSPTGSGEGRKVRRPAWAAGFVTLAVVIAFAALLTTTGRLPLSAIFPAGAPAVPTSWQLYRAPAGYFTVRVPAGWTAQRDTGHGSEGNSHTGQSASFMIYGTGLSMPPAGTSSITVGITVEPFSSDYARQWACQNHHFFTNTTVDGLPASQDDVAGWLFDTNAAHYQINYRFPGWTGNGPLTSAPTPIPQDVLHVGQTTFATILASFKPTPATPLSC